MKAPRRVQASAWGGLLFLLAAMCCFAVLDTTSKGVMAQVPALMALWVLFLVQALAIGSYVVLVRGISSVRTAHPGLQVLRGALLVSVQLLALQSLRYLPVGEYTALAMTTPLLVTLLASRFLGEHVSALRLVLVAGGLAGTLVIVRPGGDAFGWAVLWPLGLVAVNTVFQLLTSKMTRTEDAITTLFCTCVTATLLASVPLAWVWVPVAEASVWWALLLMGLSAAGGNLLFILAFERAPAASLMPYMYLQIGMALFGGWLMYDHVPDLWAVVGMAMVAAFGVGGGLLTLQEARARRRALQPTGMPSMADV